MFCSNCGARMKDGQPFCTNCGASLTGQASPANQQSLHSAGNITRTAAPRPPKAPKPKAALLKWIIVGVAAAAVITVAALNWGYIRNFFERNLSSPEKYYQTVEKRSISSVTDTLDNTAGVAGKLFSADSSKAVQGSITVSVDRNVADMLSLEAGTDMSWLRNAGVSFTIDQTQEDLIGGKFTVQLNGTDLINADGVFDTYDGMLYFRVPEFSKKYVGVEIDDLLGGGYRRGVDPQRLQALMSAMPDSKTLDKLIERYVGVIVKDVDDVERDTEEVTVDDVTCTYTTLTAEIDENTLEKILRDVARTAAKDKDLKEIIVSMANAAGEYGDEVYEDFLSSLEDVEDISIDEDIRIVMVVYVDGKGEVKGRDVKVKSEGEEVARLRYLTAEKSGKFGTEIRLEEPSVTISAIGGGTKRGDKIKGELDVEISYAYGGSFEVGTIGIDGDIGDNNFIGEISLAPSEEMLDEILSSLDVPSGVAALIPNPKIVFANHSAKNHLDMSLALKSSGVELVSLRFECSEASPLKFSVPSSYLDPEEWRYSLDTDSIMRTLRSSLKKAGVPSSVLDDLEDMMY